MTFFRSPSELVEGFLALDAARFSGLVYRRMTATDWGFASTLDDVGGAVAIVGIGDADYTQASGRTTHADRRAGDRARARRRRPRAPRTSTASCTCRSPATSSTPRPSAPHFGTAHEHLGVGQGRRHGVGRVGAVRRGAGDPLRASATYVLNTFSVAWATQRPQMVGGPGQVHAEDLYKQNLEVPFGWFPQPVYFATIARRHMHEFGTTPEQLGAIAVACRRHATLTPSAVMRDKPLSLDDYLAQPADRRSVSQGGLLPDLRRRRRLHHDVARARARSAPADHRGARRRRRQLAHRRVLVAAGRLHLDAAGLRRARRVRDGGHSRRRTSTCSRATTRSPSSR